MVTVELRAVRAGRWTPLATLTVQHDGQYVLEDPEQLVDLELPVPEHGRRLFFRDDPERWARGLPRLYHAPELRAVILDHDTDPVTTRQSARDAAAAQRSRT